jgi:hypothetical protein
MPNKPAPLLARLSVNWRTVTNANAHNLYLNSAVLVN